MKKLFFLLILISSQIVNAQIPAGFNYQAVVRNSSGDIVGNQTVKFKFSILQNSATGTPVYVETQSVNTNDFGLANLIIGKGSKLSGDLNPAGWGTNTHFLKVEIDPTNGNSFRHLGTTQLMAVPYAFHAETVTNDNVNDADTDPENELQSLTINGNNLTLSDNGGTVELPTSGSTSLWQQNGNDIYYNNGKVGIGTEPGNTKLYIKANSTVSEPHLLLEENEGDYARLTFKNTANPSKYWTWAGNCADNNNNSRMNLWYYNGSSGKDLLSISGNGNVGIGTINPRSNLEIASSDIPQIRLNNTSTGAQNVQKITFWKGTTEKFAIGYDLWGTGDDLFTLYDTPGQIPVLNIKSSNVGIGTKSPSAKLEVLATSTFAIHGISNTNYAVVGETSGSASGILGRATNNSGCGVLGVNYDSDGCAGHFEGYLYVNGNVGIGKRPPNCRLHIKQAGTGFQNGLRLERSDNSNWWSIQINSYNDLVFDYNGSNTRAWINHSTAAFQYASDRRLKTDIHPIESALSKVMQLNPVTFRFKTNPDSDKPSYGLIAQEVKKIYPEFVSENNGNLGIAYHNFSVINIRAIQEQQQEIVLVKKQIEEFVKQNKELKTENDRLKAENKQIIDRLEKLENTVNATAQKTK